MGVVPWRLVKGNSYPLKVDTNSAMSNESITPPGPLAEMCLIFMHIPKTGGTSIHSILEKHFDKGAICPERLDGLAHYSVGELRRYRYFSGHFEFPSARRIPGSPYRMTMLREPKARILSLYNFWASHSDAAIQKLNLEGPRLAKQMSLSEFLRHDADGIPGNIDNAMTRQLIGRAAAGSRFALAVPEYEALRTAAANLASFRFVGVLERMEESVEILLQDLALPPEAQVPHERNSSAIKESTKRVVSAPLPEEVDDRLNYLTRLDRKLYEFGKMLFDTKLTDMRKATPSQ